MNNLFPWNNWDHFNHVTPKQIILGFCLGFFLFGVLLVLMGLLESNMSIAHILVCVTIGLVAIAQLVHLLFSFIFRQPSKFWYLAWIASLLGGYGSSLGIPLLFNLIF